MKCPNCRSENVQCFYHTEKQGFSGSKGCCGWIIFGPIGLLCGLCGQNKVKKEEKYWVCNNCGIKFTDDDAAKSEMGNERYQTDTEINVDEVLNTEKTDFDEDEEHEENPKKQFQITDSIRNFLYLVSLYWHTF